MKGGGGYTRRAQGERVKERKRKRGRERTSLSVTREIHNDGRASRDRHEQRLCAPSSIRVLCCYRMSRLLRMRVFYPPRMYLKCNVIGVLRPTLKNYPASSGDASRTSSRWCNRERKLSYYIAFRVLAAYNRNVPEKNRRNIILFLKKKTEY